MYCKNCGKEVSEKAIVCPGCGVPPLSEHNHCQHCGVPTQSNQIMCIKCGMGLASAFGNLAIESGRGITPLNAQLAMRTCIVLSWVFFIMGVTLSVAFEDSISGGVEEGLIGGNAGVALYIALTGVAIVASVGLFKLKLWAAKLCIITVFVFTALLSFVGVNVEVGLITAVDSIGNILIGMVLGLAFFSDALKPRPQIDPTTV